MTVVAQVGTMTAEMDENPNLGWIAGGVVILAVLAGAASLWIYYH